MVKFYPLLGRETFFNVVVVFPSLISKSSEFETFMRNFYEPVLLAGGRSSLARLVVVFVDHVTDSPLENWSLKPQVHEVLKIYHTRYPDTVLTALPPSKMKFRNQAAAVEYGYARGVAHVKKLTNLHGLDDQVVLLTSTNFTLSPDVVRNCYLKTHSHFYHNNSFTNYKKRRKKPGSSVPPQLYQPIPFHVYSAADVGPWPSAMVPQSVGLHPGAGGVPAFMIHPLMGFWDVGSSHGVEDDVVLAPLCARLKDIYEPASAALNATDLHNFRESLYKAIHAGTFDIVRTPDRSFSTYIAR